MRKSGNHYLIILKEEGFDSEIIQSFLLDFLKEDISEYKNYLIIKASFDWALIKDTLNSLMCDLNQTFKVLYTKELYDFSLEDYLSQITKYFNSNLKDIFYDEKELIDEVMTLKDKDDFKELILKEYVFDFEMQNTIKTFILNDLNVLKTSKVLYMHRNTLLNRIDKFSKETGYDPRKFKDAYILYSVLK